MSYPLSSDVLPGDATAASHYNNLRADSIHLGNDPADSVNLATLLNQFQSGLHLRRHQTDATKVYVLAGARIMIDGYLCYNPSHVDLPADQVPAGGAANYYVFAKRATGSTTFTLVTKAGFVPDANERLIGQFYWTGAVVEKDSVRTSLANDIKDWLYFNEPHVFGGRLSPVNTTPVSVSDINAASSIFYVPFCGSRVSLYVPNYGWRVYPFSVMSLDISACNANMPYDVFLRNNAGTLELSYLEWNTTSTRATALTFQDGIYVLNGHPEYLFLGTFYTSAAGVYDDTYVDRLLWNHYNQIPRPFAAYDDTDSWTYNAGAWRKWRNNNATRLQTVIGLQDSLCSLFAAALAENATNHAIGVGIGINSETVNSAQIISGMITLAATYNKQNYSAQYLGHLPIGYNFMHPLERASATSTITVYGDAGAHIKSGISGWVMS